MKNIILGTSAALLTLATSGIAYAGYYVPTCGWQWYLGPYGWYQVWVCY